ncbi:MAG: ATP-binding protein [Actinomycetota bacterium]|nr:ATP-binding protein [Actinomycetota bacterium]
MPTVLAGRATQLDAVDATLSRVAHTGAPTNPIIITGTRGLGKTVILNEAASRARQRGLTVAYLTLDRGTSTPARIAAETQREATRLLGTHGGRQWARLRARFSAFTVQLSVPGVSITSAAGQPNAPEPIDRDELTRLLCDTATLLRDKGHGGLLLVLDEIQEAPEADLVLLANTMQDCVKRGAPIATLAAGLPHAPDALMNAGTFAERFTYQTVGRLSFDESTIALLEPARAMHGVLWTREAADAVLARAKGSPYLIQLFGNACWQAGAPATGHVISDATAEVGVRDAEVELWAGMFRGRWNKAGRVERQLLIAVAATIGEDGNASTSDIAAHLHRTASQLSGARRRLIDKGLLEPAGYAKLAFTMPGFEEFVRAETEA